jgi:alpha-galactosidase
MPFMLSGAYASTLVLLAVGIADARSDATVSFSATPNPHPVTGFGGEWDPHFWQPWNARRGCNEQTWNAVCQKIRDIGISRVRMMLIPEWYEPVNDNGDPDLTDQNAFTWDSTAMHSLYRHLDFCKEAGIRVTLTWWAAPVKRRTGDGPYWLAFPEVKQWCSAPNDAAEAAENVAAVLQHLLVERRYDCIDAFTFYNEPDWAFYNNENAVDFDYYATVCRAIHRRLERAGLRDRLALDLADASMHQGWLKQCVDNIDDIVDRYNSHNYVFSCEDADYPVKMREWVRKRVALCHGKPWATNELGTSHYSGAYSVTDLETFERAFCVAQYAILGLNEGLAGALFWGLYDQYYYDGDDPNDGSNGGLMKTNLMAYVGESWRLRRTGQAWTLICKGAPRGAKVYPGMSDDPHLDAVALALPDGGVNVLLTNRAKERRAVHLRELPGHVATEAVGKMRAFTREGISPVAVEANRDLSAPAESLMLVSFPNT